VTFQHGTNVSGNIAVILEMISIIPCTFYTHCIALRPQVCLVTIKVSDATAQAEK